MASTTSQPSTSRRSKDSDRIGSFQRHEEIGRGSFATVYKAVHTVSQALSIDPAEIPGLFTDRSSEFLR